MTCPIFKNVVSIDTWENAENSQCKTIGARQAEARVLKPFPPYTKRIAPPVMFRHVVTVLIPFCEGRIGNPSYSEKSATFG